MLCPEVWKFSPPDSCTKTITGEIQKENSRLPPPLNNFYFGHLVSLVLPNIEELRNIAQSFTEDFQYYKADNVGLNDLCSKEFINNFIKKGSLTALSLNTKIDQDDCVCITPEGILVLSLNKNTFQQLGIEGRPSNFSQKRKDRYIIHLNLKADTFTSNKTYQKIRECLKTKLPKFNLLFSWEPPEENICPSSLAKFLDELEMNVTVCTPKLEFRTNKNIKMPVISKDEDFSAEELVEWLGMLSLNIDINSGSFDSFTNTYEPPENGVEIQELGYLEWKGFFTVHQIETLYNNLKKNLSAFSSVPWISLYVHGFSDTPVSWKLQEHRFHTNGNNGFILFLQPSGQYLIYTKSCSQKKQK